MDEEQCGYEKFNDEGKEEEEEEHGNRKKKNADTGRLDVLYGRYLLDYRYY